MGVSTDQPSISEEVLRDQWARLNTLYKVIDRDSNIQQFQARWAQEDLYRMMWYRNLILKARQLGFCLDPNTRVLTADREWVPIAELEPGQRIVSVDEYIQPGYSSRAIREGVVEGVVEVYREAYRITFDDGRTLVCTDQHPWLSRRTKGVPMATKWRYLGGFRDQYLGPEHEVRWVADANLELCPALKRKNWYEQYFRGKASGDWSEIVDVEYLGEQTLIDLQTDRGTYIAEGFVSHNTTFIDLFILDTCLFNSHVSAAIIAHTKEDAQRIFREKVKFPYDNLPETLRQARTTETEQASELIFDNGSSIRVTASARSGTVQLLHISEFGKLAAKYPEKAREIKSGSLEAVPSGGIVFIESTAEGQEGAFYEMAIESRDRQQADEPLTRLDFEFHFFPWWKEPSYKLDTAEANKVTIPQRLEDYFQRLYKENGISLTPEQKAWYTKKEKTQGEDMLKEHPSTPEEAFQATIHGAYFARQMTDARSEQRITTITPDRSIPVDTWWDLGVGDSTAIWFTQTVGRELWIVDYFEDEGEGLPYYAEVLFNKARERGWRYGKHTAPHDIAVRELGTGKTRLDTARQNGIDFEVAPRPERKEDAIQAARNLLTYCYFDEKHCEQGLAALAAYRKEWDEKKGTWKNQPRHDWASHGADAFQVLAAAHSFGPSHPHSRPVIIPSAKGWT